MFGLEYIVGFLQNFGYCKASVNGKCYSSDSLTEMPENNTNDNRNGFMEHIYSSKLWNILRKKLSTTNVNLIQSIVTIDDKCRKPNDMVYCYHNVKYVYNNIEQEGEFSSHDVVKICTKLNYKMSPHFSQEMWCTQIVIPHSGVTKSKRRRQEPRTREPRTREPRTQEPRTREPRTQELRTQEPHIPETQLPKRKTKTKESIKII